MKCLWIVPAAIALVACVPYTEAELAALNKDATVSRYSADSVTIESWSEETNAEITAEAQKVCSMTGRRAQVLGVHDKATPDSVSYVTGGPSYKSEHEFACLPA